MPRSPRIFFANSVYEVVSRTRDTLPLPPTETTNELLRGILARAQLTDGVLILNEGYYSHNPFTLAFDPSSTRLRLRRELDSTERAEVSRVELAEVSRTVLVKGGQDLVS